MDFKYRLRDLRREFNLTTNQLAEIVGTKRYAISDWENGMNYPTTPRLIKLAEYFQTSVDYLLGLTDDRRPYPRAGENIDEDNKVIYLGNLTEEQQKFVKEYVKAQHYLNKKD